MPPRDGVDPLGDPDRSSAPDPAESQFDDEHAFTQYNRWQLQMLELGDG